MIVKIINMVAVSKSLNGIHFSAMFKFTMDETDKIMHDAYYKVDSPSCYSNALFVLREARKKNKNITIDQVKNFLAKQDVYTLHHRHRKNYRRNATISAGLDMHWQADLADMMQYRRENLGNSYLLICVDVFSRYAFVRCIKSKTAQEVGDAFQDIITTTHRRPFNLMTDKGSEFRGDFKKMIKANDINHFFATSPDVKASIAERYIRTLKSRIQRYFMHRRNKKAYHDVLQQIVTSINHSVNRTIGCTPASITRDREKELWDRVYAPLVRKSTSKHKYKVGDLVRISMKRDIMQKGYLPHFSKRVYPISKLLHKRTPPTYKLFDHHSDQDLGGVFYEEELVRVVPTSKGFRVIEAIIKTKTEGGKKYNLVQWKNTKEAEWVEHGAPIHYSKPPATAAASTSGLSS